MTSSAHKASWTRIILQTALHVIVGTVVFVVIGAVAVLLHSFVGWMEAHKLPIWMITAATWLSYALFGADCLLFGIYLARTVYHFGKQMIVMEID